MISDAQWADLLHTRATDPQAVYRLYTSRIRRASLLSDNGTLFLVAADHTARGAMGIPGDPAAMVDRRSLLERLLIALSNPAVDGVLGTPDIVEELLLLGALENKVVIGSMNRGGLAGADWEIDDRFTAYTAQSIVDFRLDGGKMLLRIVDTDAGTVPTLQACADAVTSLAEKNLMAMVEPLPYRRDNGKLTLLKDSLSLARASTVASALGVTSAYTWLKLPAPEDPEAVLSSTTLPTVVLGGVPSARVEDDIASWGRALRHPVVRGLVIGRALLYPPDGDVAAAIDAAAKVLHEGVSA
ncbi:aldolase [Actinocrispum sp. NPDC049592]|uniref:Cgl0159 family (beta/alpha)8-fold protein n=1 Tax=Actinocrispum sp. NPDC049592 TaxID=3154835 RepID=UPI003425C0D6